MGEDVTKLKKNIDAIKKIAQGGKENGTEEKGSTDKPEGSKEK